MCFLPSVHNSDRIWRIGRRHRRKTCSRSVNATLAALFCLLNVALASDDSALASLHARRESPVDARCTRRTSYERAGKRDSLDAYAQVVQRTGKRTTLTAGGRKYGESIVLVSARGWMLRFSRCAMVVYQPGPMVEQCRRIVRRSKADRFEFKLLHVNLKRNTPVRLRLAASASQYSGRGGINLGFAGGSASGSKTNAANSAANAAMQSGFQNYSDKSSSVTMTFEFFIATSTGRGTSATC
jgi:hypothetical protein